MIPNPIAKKKTNKQMAAPRRSLWSTRKRVCEEEEEEGSPYKSADLCLSAHGKADHGWVLLVLVIRLHDLVACRLF